MNNSSSLKLPKDCGGNPITLKEIEKAWKKELDRPSDEYGSECALRYIPALLDMLKGASSPLSPSHVLSPFPPDWVKELKNLQPTVDRLIRAARKEGSKRD